MTAAKSKPQLQDTIPCDCVLKDALPAVSLSTPFNEFEKLPLPRHGLQNSQDLDFYSQLLAITHFFFFSGLLAPYKRKIK